MNKPTILIRALASILLGGTMLLSGCATIVNGSTQKVKIGSQPAGAEVSIDGASSGITPTVADLSRKTSHRVALSLKGYRPYEVVLEPGFNGLTLGNVLVGGIIGIVVDGSTGAGNTLKPAQIDAVLQKK